MNQFAIMKIHRLIKNAAITLIVLAVAFSVTRAKAQTILTGYTNTFPNEGNTGMYPAPNWIYWFGLYQDEANAAPGDYNLQGTNDAGMTYSGDTNDFGSMYVYAPWQLVTNVTYGVPSQDQNVFDITFGANPFDQTSQIQMIVVTNMSWYIHVDPSSTPDENGNFGTLAGGFIATDYKNRQVDYLTIPGSATNGWVLMQETNVASFIAAANAENTANPSAAYAFGVCFDQNSYGSSPVYPTNKLAYWIDNIIVNTATKPPPPPPPPTVSIAPAIKGLNLFTGTGTSLYNREDIEASTANYSWVGATGPVSYSFTITNYSVGSNDAVQCQIFLIPNPGAEAAPDYTEPNLIFMDLESTTIGASVNFRYKTNEMNGNAMVYGVGTLASLGTNTAIGTWTLTFNNNTNVTMTIPGGANTNFNIPDSTGATSALFTSGVALYFGVQAGNAGGAEDHIVASEFKVTGITPAFDDNFVTDDGALNTSIWTTNAAFPACVQMVGAGSSYWVQWTTPAPSFVLETTSNLETGTWTAVTNHVAISPGTNIDQLISTSDLLSGGTGFFALIQHNLNSLQVLLPGQTATPGVSPGYSGTPTPYSISSGNVVTVTVNAVDEHWNLIPGINDSVTLTTSDPSATISPPATGPLVGGTEQFTVVFATTGPQTVTATDNTDKSLAATTSASITVTP
jgi:hypothetical protein